MWTIRQLKERGKSCFQRNYWKAVLVAVIISMIGGMPGSRAIKTVTTIAFELLVNIGADTNAQSINGNNFEFNFGDDGESDFDYDYEFDFGDDFGDDFAYPYGGYENHDQGIVSDFASRLDGYAIGVIVAIAILVFFILIIALIIRILIDIFFFNPLFVGTQRFFIHNLSEQGMVGDMGFGFDRNYKNQVRVMFARDLYTFCWSLLFLIPGIYKSYEYRMIPYLMAEYPNMPKDQVFYTSKFLMKGNKWRTFVMDLSFIGWWLLSGLTCGLVGIFYVNPYYISTCAALYEALKMIKGIPAMNNGYNAPGQGSHQSGYNEVAPESVNAFTPEQTNMAEANTTAWAQSSAAEAQTDFNREQPTAAGGDEQFNSTDTNTATQQDQPVEGPGFVMHSTDTRGDSNEEN